MKSFHVLICVTLFSAAGSAVSGFVDPTIPSSSMPTPMATAARSNTFVVGSTTTTESRNTEEIATIVESRCESGGTILDENAMLASQNFPIPPETLVEKAKAALIKDSGVLDPSLWAENFEFCAPYVGPLSKAEFLDAADGFGIYEAFPDFDNRYFGFTVDPIESGRVWFMTRLRATNDGVGLFGKKEPSNKTVVLPPQMYSFLFDGDGLIRELTVGYPVDRRQGTTGGLGGMFGVFYGIGQPLPIPEGKPYQLSRRFRLFTKLGSLAGKLTNKNKE